MCLCDHEGIIRAALDAGEAEFRLTELLNGADARDVAGCIRGRLERRDDGWALAAFERAWEKSQERRKLQNQWLLKQAVEVNSVKSIVLPIAWEEH